MDLLQAIILGLVQGATEYIPVSSSAHLVLVPWLLGWPDSSFAFEVLIQLGTLVGVFIFFWPDIWAIIRGVLQGLRQGQPLGTPEARLGWLVVVATIPAVILGFLFKDYFEGVYDNPVFTGVLLTVNALILVTAEYFSARRRELDSLSWFDAIVIGFWQAAAILPGVSRSGSTIGGAMLIGFTRPAAARFSFIMSIPALLGAGVIALADLVEQGNLGTEALSITVGFVVAAISGYACIRWLLRYLQSHSLYIFAAYCFAVSLVTLLVAFIRG